VGFAADPEKRDGETMLRVWPTLPAVATAVARSGIDVGDAPALAAAMVTWAQRDPVDVRGAARARFDEALTFDGIGRDLRAAYESLVPAQ
jgi:hypothetical protein